MEAKQFGAYVVYPDGRIYSIFKKRFLKPYVSDNGYERIRLYKDKEWQSTTVHRLVATLFLEKPKSKDQVNHKNGIKTDNRAENLEWCTGSENQKHSWAMGLIKSAHARIIIDTRTGVFYESVAELAKLLNVSKVYLAQKLNGYRKNNTHYLYT
jgi:hypothetical protein